MLCLFGVTLRLFDLLPKIYDSNLHVLIFLIWLVHLHTNLYTKPESEVKPNKTRVMKFLTSALFLTGGLPANVLRIQDGG